MKTSKRKRSSAKAVAGVEAVAAPVESTVEAVVETSTAPIEATPEHTSGPVAVVVDEEATVEIPVVTAAAADPVIVLNANCTVKDAAALKASLLAVSKQSAAVTVDASALERIDTATMQLLCAFARDRSGRNQSIVWKGESQVLQDAARLLGVRALLGFEAANGVAA